MADNAHTTERVLTYQNAIQTVMVAVLLSGVPWAYYIGNKVAVIEAQTTISADASTKAAASYAAELREIKADLRETERRVAGLESEIAIIKQLAEGARNRGQAK